MQVFPEGMMILVLQFFNDLTPNHFLENREFAFSFKSKGQRLR